MLSSVVLHLCAFVQNRIKRNNRFACGGASEPGAALMTGLDYDIVWVICLLPVNLEDELHETCRLWVLGKTNRVQCERYACKIKSGR
jgi:hypothetical protein